jgi:hypothetical protein
MWMIDLPAIAALIAKDNAGMRAWSARFEVPSTDSVAKLIASLTSAGYAAHAEERADRR